MKRAIIFSMATAVAICACGQRNSTGDGSSVTGGTGGTANAGGTTSTGGTSNTGVTSDAGPVCNATIPINAGDTCDIESPPDAAAPPDAGSASDLTKVGPYAVGHVSYMLSDITVYARPVAVSVWYPVDSATVTSATPPAQYPLDPWSNNRLPVSTSTDWEALGYDRAYEGPTASGNGPFPLVMLSPGYTDDNWEYLYAGTRLASHGFVVAVIDHDNEGQYSWSPPPDGEVVAMFNRPRDVSFAITELLLKNDTIGEQLHAVIDPSKIAMSGHSLGGYTAYALAGGDDEVCDSLFPANYDGESQPYPQSTCAPTAPDTRIRAIVSLDGASWGMRYRELARISVPSLILGETVEHVVSYSYNPTLAAAAPELGLGVARPHAAITRSDSCRVDVAIANHLSFSSFCDGLRVMSSLGVNVSTAIPGASEDAWPCAVQGTFDPANNPATRQIVTTYVLAFLNTYFGREDDSWMLTSSYASQYQPSVEFFDSEACNECQVGQGDYAYRPHPCQCSAAQQDPPGYFAPLAPDGGAP